MNAKRLFPGMRDGNLEIFFLEDEDELKAIKDGQIKDFDDLKPDDITFLSEIIDSEEKLKSVLQEWYPHDADAQIKQLAKCRFGGLNLLPDVSPCGKITPDYINCSYRGSCSGENVICKPIEYNGYELSEKEIKAIRLMSTNKKNTAVCSELSIPEGSFNVFRTQLYVKLGNINTKQELTRIGVKLGIS